MNRKDNDIFMFQGLLISHLPELTISLRIEHVYSANTDHSVWMIHWLIHSLIDLFNQKLLLKAYYGVPDVKIYMYMAITRQTSGNAYILKNPGILTTLYTQQRKLHATGTQKLVMVEIKHYIFFKNW